MNVRELALENFDFKQSVADNFGNLLALVSDNLIGSATTADYAEDLIASLDYFRKSKGE